MVVEPVQQTTTTDTEVYPVTLEFSPEQYQLLQSVTTAVGRSVPDAIRLGLGLLRLYDQTKQAGGRMLTEVNGRVQEILNLG
jgi:hypothetical protein